MCENLTYLLEELTGIVSASAVVECNRDGDGVMQFSQESYHVALTQIMVGLGHNN